MISVKSIKNRMKQIKKNKIEIKNDFPYKENMARNKFRKHKVFVIFIDICDFTKQCLDNKGDKNFYLNLRLFNEGILDIFKMYGIKNIDIQGDGIFGIIKHNKKNNGDVRILDCAIHVKSFLNFFLNYFKFKISISFGEEWTLIAGRKGERKIVYFGGCVNEAKKLNDKEDAKIWIVMSKNFCDNNIDNNLRKKYNILDKDDYCICKFKNKEEWILNEKE